MSSHSEMTLIRINLVCAKINNKLYWLNTSYVTFYRNSPHTFHNVVFMLLFVVIKCIRYYRYKSTLETATLNVQSTTGFMLLLLLSNVKTNVGPAAYINAQL